MTVAEFENFLENYEKDVFTFCRYLAMEYNATCDLYQETVLAAFEMIGRIDAAQNPKSFLFSIAVGKWKNIRRKIQRRQNIAPEITLEEWSGGQSLGNPTSETVEKTLMQEQLHNAIAGLPDKLRIPLVLHYFDDCKVEEIGIILKIPAGTAKSRLHKARAILKEVLQK